MVGQAPPYGHFIATDIAVAGTHLTSLTARDLIAAIPAALQRFFPEPTSSQDATRDSPPLLCRKSPKYSHPPKVSDKARR